MADPRTMREALAAQVLAEIDGLLTRIEALPANIASAEAQLKTTTDALANAGDQFRLAVTAFTEQAKTELTQHLERKAAETVSHTAEHQRAVMLDAARHAFRSQASDQVEKLAGSLRGAASEFRRAAWTRVLENTAVAMVASGITAAAVYGLLR